MFEDYFAVIMAGGSGTRLWPLSRKNRPKQSLVISGGRTLFQQAVDRLEGLFPPERILIVTVSDQVDLLKHECPRIPFENFLIEPLPRGTASVVGLAALAIQDRVEGGTMAILTADHLIENDRQLRQLLRSAYSVAQEDYLVTLGITPNLPSTGYGYIQIGKSVGPYEGLDVFKVLKFKEKPERALAEKFLADGDHVWNSGMFIWKVDMVVAEIARQMPDLFEKLEGIKHARNTDLKSEILHSIWPTIIPQTIDYGIMEHALKVAVIPSEHLGWNDVGSWDSLFDALNIDESGNIILQGDPLTFDTQGTLICEDSPDRLIVTVGVQDLVIIDSGNALLICDRKQSQRVREIVNYLKDKGREDYL